MLVHLIMEQIVPYIAAGRKCPPLQLQRVRTSTDTIGVPDAASNCYLHKGRPFNICMHDQGMKGV